MGATLSVAILLLAVHARAQETNGGAYRWRVSAMGGQISYEGDEAVRDAALGAVLIGYALSPRWTLEGVIESTPELKSNYRRDWATLERISRLSEDIGRDRSRTAAWRFALDGLMHLAPSRRIDPYLAAGVGVVAYAHDFGQRHEPLLRAGAGLFANLTPRWALRLDCRAVLAGLDTEVNLVTTVGAVFRLGDEAPRRTGDFVAAPDFETVRMFELNLNFDPGKWEIKPEYRSELDVIGRLLETRPGARARIEGHEQVDDESDEEAAQFLSEKRAGAVRDYLLDDWNLRASRVTATGLGITRPKNDLVPSRRIEVYVTTP